MSWSIVIPVKRLIAAKSRLRSSLAETDALALAFAVDTVTAALGSGLVSEVIVVTSDVGVSRQVVAVGARVVEDPGGGLNPAAAAGIAFARGERVGVLTGDLPSLRPADLDGALLPAGRVDLTMVADRSGLGTTLLTAQNRELLHPRFGLGSRGRHESAGHVVLDVPERSSLRLDVDTVADLDAAVMLGVGAATARVVSRAPDGAGGPQSVPATVP